MFSKPCPNCPQQKAILFNWALFREDDYDGKTGYGFENNDLVKAKSSGHAFFLHLSEWFLYRDILLATKRMYIMYIYIYIDENTFEFFLQMIFSQTVCYNIFVGEPWIRSHFCVIFVDADMFGCQYLHTCTWNIYLEVSEGDQWTPQTQYPSIKTHQNIFQVWMKTTMTKGMWHMLVSRHLSVQVW